MEAVVLGATGLIGKELLRQLFRDPSFFVVRALTRKPLLLDHPKFLAQVTDFDDEEDFREKIGTGTIVFCCVGTTMKQVNGDKDAYRKVDYDIPIRAARFASEAGFKQFVLVSAASANPDARNFYSRLKGEVERDLEAIRFQSIHIFQPSVLLGEREEPRPLERMVQKLSRAISLLLPSKFKPVDARTISLAMLQAVKKPKEGTRRYQYKSIVRLARK